MDGLYASLITKHEQPLSTVTDLSIIKKQHEKWCQDHEPPLSDPPEKIVPGTIGELLYGCYVSNDGCPVACTPSCLNGFSNPGLIPCNLSAYQKEGCQMRKINDLCSCEAVIFLEPDTRFNLGDKVVLRKEGVSSVHIYQRTDSTLNYTLLQEGELDNIGVSEPTHPPPPAKSSNYSWIWIAGILVLLVIIAVILAR